MLLCEYYTRNHGICNHAYAVNKSQFCSSLLLDEEVSWCQNKLPFLASAILKYSQDKLCFMSV